MQNQDNKHAKSRQPIHGGNIRQIKPIPHCCIDINRPASTASRLLTPQIYIIPMKNANNSASFSFNSYSMIYTKPTQWDTNNRIQAIKYKQ